MPEFITFVSPKGGSGATFSCAGTWYSFAKKNAKILAVDLCGKRSALDYALGFQNDSVYDVSDVISGTCSLEDAICTSEVFENACFLRAGFEKADLTLLKNILSKTDFEYVLIDAMCDDFDGVSDISDKVIVVSECTEVSAKICDTFSTELNWDKSYIIINKIIPSYIESGFMPNLDEVTDGIGLRPMGLIPWSPDAVVLFSGKEEKFSDKNIAMAFDNITTRITGKSIPAIDFKTKYECFKTKKRR